MNPSNNRREGRCCAVSREHRVRGWGPVINQLEDLKRQLTMAPSGKFGAEPTIIIVLGLIARFIALTSAFLVFRLTAMT